MLRILLAVGGIQVIAILISIVRSKLVALLLGPEGLGVVSVVDQVVQLVAYISAFSLPYVAVRFLSRAHSESAENFQRAYAWFLSVIIMLATAGAAVGVGLALVRPSLFGDTLATHQVTLSIALLGVPGALLGGFIPNVLASAGKVKASALMAVVTNLGLTVAWAGGILIGGVPGMYVASVTTTMAIAIGGLWYIQSTLGVRWPGAGLNPFTQFAQNKRVFTLAIVFAAGAVASSWALLVMRQAVLGSAGESAAGLLQSAYVLALSISLVLNPTNGLYLTPIMNRDLPHQEKLSVAVEYLHRLTVLLVIVAAPLVLFPQTLLYILFSERFTPVAHWVFLFVTAQVITQIAGVFQAILIGLDEVVAYAVVTCFGFALTGVASAIFIPEFGIGAAGIALAAGSSATAIGALLVLMRRHKLVVSRRTGLLLMYSAVVCVGVGGAAAVMPEWTAPAMAIRVGAGLLVAAILWTLTDADDKALLTGAVRRATALLSSPQSR